MLRDVKVTSTFGHTSSCGNGAAWPPLVSSDGKSFTCSTGSTFITYPLSANVRGTGKGRVDFQTGLTERNYFPTSTLWTSKTGGTLIAVFPDSHGTIRYYGPDPQRVTVDVISHGKATPLPFPKGFTGTYAGLIAW